LVFTKIWVTPTALVKTSFVNYNIVNKKKKVNQQKGRCGMCDDDVYVEVLESDECDCEYDDEGRLVYECIMHLEGSL
jgi:hypothetical protein